ncbi:MAG: type II toxin-antitoxin system VapB family antitoxin [Acidimicrobiia bacterium]
MALSIKNEKADELARELARLTGKSITEAIVLALEGEVARRRNKTDIGAALKSLSEELAKYPVLDDRDPDEILYDEHGLPK